MQVTDPNTVFLKLVAQVLMDHHEPVRDAVRLHLKDLSDQALFNYKRWNELVLDVGRSMDNNLQLDPQRALSIFAAIGASLSQHNAYRMRDVLHTMLQGGHLVELCKQARLHEDCRYCLAATLAVFSNLFLSDEQMDSAITGLIGAPVKLVPRTRADGTGDLTEAITSVLFGRHWSALYMHDDIDTKEIISIILHQRPPFADGATMQALNVWVPVGGLAETV